MEDMHMKDIQYKDNDMNQLLTRKRKPHSFTRRSTPFPYCIAQNKNKIITIHIIEENEKH